MRPALQMHGRGKDDEQCRLNRHRRNIFRRHPMPAGGFRQHGRSRRTRKKSQPHKRHEKHLGIVPLDQKSPQMRDIPRDMRSNRTANQKGDDIRVAPNPRQRNSQS